MPAVFDTLAGAGGRRSAAGGDSLQVESLGGLVAEHKVPMQTELFMKVGLLHDRFPQEKVLEVQVKRKRNAALIRTIIGAAIDAAWIIAMATYDCDSFSWGGGGSYLEGGTSMVE